MICVLLAGAGSAWASKKALVEVGFAGVPPPNFQNVLLNVQSVRINPSATAGPGSGKWQTIPVPPGIGSAGQTADLQIDLNTSQNIPQLFNTANVRVDTYRTVELRLDPTYPGSLVPDCPLSAPISTPKDTADGCISYPIQLATGSSIITVTAPNGGTLFSTANGVLTPLILQVSMSAPVAPTVPGGAYTVKISMATLPNSVLGIVTGSVSLKTGSGSATSKKTGKVSKKTRKLSVTAEAIGTNTPIATAPVNNGQFTLELPAAGGPAAPGFGTLYDLAVAGGTDSYAAERLPPLYPGQSLPSAFTVTGGKTLGNITGSLSDNCVATKPIVGATLQLLIPPDSNSTADCFTSPEQCVAVATANTDNAGNFPLPGTITIPPEFGNVPVQAKSLPNTGAYVMEISAPGYDNLFVYAIPSTGTGKKSGGTCGTDGVTFGPCDLALNTGYISGTIPITPPNPGQTTLVQVFAEDAGTNNVESALAMPVIVRNSSPDRVKYTLNVPPSVPAFDLFATTIDLYQGVTDPYQGHTIAVLSDVTGPGEPSGPNHVCTPAPGDFPDDQKIACVGHGSVTGSVANANLGTSVVLSKQAGVDVNNNPIYVAITNTLVQNQAPNTPSSSNYSFCAPADIYQVQEWQLPIPDSSAAPSSSPTASPVPDTAAVVIIPTPLSAGGANPTPTPAINCPTNCENPDGTCPGICNNVVQALPPGSPTPTPTPTPPL